MNGLVWPMLLTRRGPGRADDIIGTAVRRAGLASASLPSAKDAALEWARGLPQERHVIPRLGRELEHNQLWL